MDTVRIYSETLQKFKADFPDFIGSKMIYAPVRNMNDDVLDKYISICIEIKVSFIAVIVSNKYLLIIFYSKNIQNYWLDLI